MAPIAAAMMSAFTSIGSTVGATATTAAGTAGAVSTAGSTIASILQGTATALSVFGTIGAANTEATSMELAAGDAEQEKSLKMLQGIERRTSIKKAMMDAVGSQNTAYAASGVDLTFGTPGEARKDAFREADLGIETAIGTEEGRIGRLDERAANLRARAKATRSAGLLQGAVAGLGGASSILNRGVGQIKPRG